MSNQTPIVLSIRTEQTTNHVIPHHPYIHQNPNISFSISQDPRHPSDTFHRWMLFDCPTYQREQTHTRHPIHHYTCLDMMAMRSDLPLFQKEDSPTHPREQLTLTLKQDCWDIPHPTRSIKRTTCRKNKCIFSSVNFIDGVIEFISRKPKLCVFSRTVSYHVKCQSISHNNHATLTQKKVLKMVWVQRPAWKLDRRNIQENPTLIHTWSKHSWPILHIEPVVMNQFAQEGRGFPTHTQASFESRHSNSNRPSGVEKDGGTKEQDSAVMSQSITMFGLDPVCLKVHLNTKTCRVCKESGG